MTSQNINRRAVLLQFGAISFGATMVTGFAAMAEGEPKREEEVREREGEKDGQREPEKKAVKEPERSEKKGKAEKRKEKKRNIEREIEALNADSETKRKIRSCATSRQTARGLEECLESSGVPISEVFPNGIPFK